MSDNKPIGSVTVTVADFVATVTLDRPPVNAVEPGRTRRDSGCFPLTE